MSSDSNAQAGASKLDAKTFPLRTMTFLLCIVSGSLDAISFLALGEAFASVMTGNIVFMGVAAGTCKPRLALFAGLAISGYLIGVVAGSLLVRRVAKGDDSEVWPHCITKALGVQLCVLTTACGVWIAVDGKPTQHLELGLLLMAAGVMGIQGAAIRNLGVSVSTTYMTGALTLLFEAVATRRPFSSTESSAVGGLLALAAGALLGSITLTYIRVAAFMVPVIALSTVLVIRLTYRRFN